MDKTEQLVVIDATDLLVGRFATAAATFALHGRAVRIINCEKARISGKKKEVLAQWKRQVDMGTPRKGPFIIRWPDRIVRRIIRGMLPYKQARGRDAFERIICYIGVPADLKDALPITIKGAQVGKLPMPKSLSVGDLCKELGGSWNE